MNIAFRIIKLCLVDGMCQPGFEQTQCVMIENHSNTLYIAGTTSIESRFCPPAMNSRPLEYRRRIRWQNTTVVIYLSPAFWSFYQ
jgi:hypothetical protein